VSGRVQRVGFRLFVEDAGRREGLTGYVRNQHGGTVEVVVEGAADAIERFEMAVRRGPNGARVDAVDTIELVPSNQFGSFRVTG